MSNSTFGKILGIFGYNSRLTSETPTPAGTSPTTMLCLTLKQPLKARDYQSMLTTVLSSLPGSLDPTIQNERYSTKADIERYRIEQAHGQYGHPAKRGRRVVIECDVSSLPSSDLESLCATLSKLISSSLITLNLNSDGLPDAD